MRVGDILYFSPNYKFSELRWSDKEKLIEAFKDRVEGFYLKPAKKLNEERHGFAAGVLCVATIDFLARIETGLLNATGRRFKKWLKDNIKEFNENDPLDQNITLAYRFYDEFRNGLVHEGRIKNVGQFSYEFDELVRVENSVMIVNPEKLLEKIERSFNRYIEKIRRNESAFQAFKCALIRDFQRDVEYARSR